jgi:HK97 family phage portal protein
MFGKPKIITDTVEPLGTASIGFGSSYTTRTVKHLDNYTDIPKGVTDTSVNSTFTTSDLVHKCVDYLASTVSQVRFNVKQKSPNGNLLEPIRDKKLINLFDTAPNEYQTWSELLYIETLSTQLTGNSYITFEKVKGSYEMWAINSPQDMEVTLNKQDGLIAGYLFNGKVEYTKDEVIHNRLPVLGNDYYGVSAIQSLIDQLLLEGYGTQDLIKFYKNGLVSSSILTSEQPLTKNQANELTKSIGKDFTINGDKRQSLIVLPNNLSVKPLRINPNDAMLLDSLNISEDRILSAFKLHKMVLGGTLDAYTHNIDALLEMQFTNAIRPLISRFIDKLQAFLRRVTKNDKLVIEPDYSNLPEIKLSKLVHTDTARNLYVSGLVSLNEGRAILGLPSVDAELADQNHLPSFLVGTDLHTIQNLTPETIGKIRSQVEGSDNKQEVTTDKLGGKNNGKDDKV